MKGKKFLFSLGVFISVGVLVLSFSCTQSFSLNELIDGPDGRSLLVTPNSAQLLIAGSLTIEAAGGIPPYTYTITSGPGTMNGNIYTATSEPGVVTIMVKDKVGSHEEVILTVVDTMPVSPPGTETDVDYFISTPPSGGVSAIVGDPISAQFIITNQGSDAGSATIHWTAFMSADTVYNAGDLVVDTGSVAQLGAAGVSGGITIDSGTWTAAGNWYLLIRVQATDEVNTTNNIRASSTVYSVTLSSPTQPDYKPSDLTMYSPFVTSGSPVQERFNLVNIGSVGGQDVAWKVYASLDTVLNIPGDIELGDGTVGLLNSGQSISGIPLLGATWPPDQGAYYLIVSTAAGDESHPGDYAVSAGTYTISTPPNYAIENVTYPLDAEVGKPISGGFTIRNVGSGNGKKILSWQVLLSYDMGLSVDDLSIGSGIFGPLASGGSVHVLASNLVPANWPNHGRCYVLIRIQADDDGNSVNDLYRSPLTELYIYDEEGSVPNGTANDGKGPQIGTIMPSQALGPLKLGQTLVVRGWLDNMPNNEGWDTYSVVLGLGVTAISTYASWTANEDICDVYLWNEINGQFISTANASYREPADRKSVV